MGTFLILLSVAGDFFFTEMTALNPTIIYLLLPLIVFALHSCSKRVLCGPVAHMPYARWPPFEAAVCEAAMVLAAD